MPGQYEPPPGRHNGDDGRSEVTLGAAARQAAARTAGPATRRSPAAPGRYPPSSPAMNASSGRMLSANRA